MTAAEHKDEVPRDALPLADYAKVMAHIAHFRGSKVALVLDRLGVVSSVWGSTQRYWTATLRQDIDRTGTPVATEFASEYGRARGALEEQRPALHEVTPIVAPREVEADYRPVDATSFLVRPAAAALPFTKEYRDAPAPTNPSALPPADTGATAELRRPSDLAAIPFGREIADDKLRDRFTLANYASLHAELLAHPDQTTQIHARYDLGERGTRERVDEAWSRHFAKNPADEQRFDELRATYLEWVRRG